MADMADSLSLKSLSPAQRAQLIYGAAKDAVSDRLWQAALGTQPSGGDADRDSSPTLTRQANLDSLMALMTQQAQQAQREEPVPVSTPALVAAPSPSLPFDSHTSEADVERVGGLGANARYAGILESAAGRTGIPAAALAAIVNAEAAKGSDGSWQTLSRNPRSSAAGLGQFLSRTWEGMAKTSGTWLNGVARANNWLGEDGQVRAEARPQLLALRYDPGAAINGVADYARQNLNALSRAGVSTAGDVEATARVAYLGHHLGLGDAIRFLRSGGLDEGRAHTLLAAQIGTGASDRRIAATGNATAAHRSWLLGVLDNRINANAFL